MAVKIKTQETANDTNLNGNNWQRNIQPATQGNVVETISAYNEQVDKQYYDKNQIVTDENRLENNIDEVIKKITTNWSSSDFRASADSTTNAVISGTSISASNITADSNAYTSAGILQKLNILSQLISGKTNPEWQANALGNVAGTTNPTNDNTPVVARIKPTDASTDAYYTISSSKVQGLEKDSNNNDLSTKTVLTESQIASMVNASIKYVHNVYDNTLSSIVSYLIYTTKGLSDSFRWVLKWGSVVDEICDAPLYVQGWDSAKCAWEIVKAGADDVDENGKIESSDCYYYHPSSDETPLVSDTNNNAIFTATTSEDGKTIAIKYKVTGTGVSTTYTINVPTYRIEFDVDKTDEGLKFESIYIKGNNNDISNFGLSNIDIIQEDTTSGIGYAMLPLGTQFTLHVRDTVKCFYITDIDKTTSESPTNSYSAINNKGNIRNFGLTSYSSNTTTSYTNDSVVKSSMRFTCYQTQINLYLDDNKTTLLNSSFIDQFGDYSVKLGTTPSKENFTIQDSLGGDISNVTYSNDTVSLESVNSIKDIVDIWLTWTPNEGTICLKYNYDDCPSDIVISGNTVETTVTLPTVSREGYGFTGWYNNSSATDTKYETYKITSEGITLYAGWEANTYTINYILNNGKLSDNSDSVSYSETTTLVKPTRLGYEFAGWYTSPNFTSVKLDANVKVSGSMTLYAKWDIITYNINYDLNETESGETNELINFDLSNFNSFTVEQLPFALGNPENTGYSFVGWKNSSDSTSGTTYEKITLDNISSLADSKNEIKLVAQWTPKEVEYTIELYCLSGSNYDLYYTYQHMTSIQSSDSTGTNNTIVSSKVGDTIDSSVIEELKNNKIITLPSGYTIAQIDPIVLSGNKENVIKVFNDTLTYKVTYHNICFFNDAFKSNIGVLKAITNGVSATTGSIANDYPFIVTSQYSTSAKQLLSVADATTFAMDGFTFTGWVDSDGNATTEIPAYTDSDVDYYATWEQDAPDTSSVSWTPNEHTSGKDYLSATLKLASKNSVLQKLEYNITPTTTSYATTIAWTEATTNGKTYTTKDVGYSGYVDFNDIGLSASNIYLKYDSITLESAGTRSIIVKESENTKDTISVKFNSKGIFAYYVATNTFDGTDKSNGVIPTSATSCAVIVRPLDSAATAGITTEDQNVDDKYEVVINSNAYDKLNYELIGVGSIADSDGDNIKEMCFNLTSTSTYSIYWNDTSRYNSSSKNNHIITISSKKTQVTPGTETANALAVTYATSVGELITNSITNITNNLHCRYYNDSGAKAIPSTLTGGQLIYKRSTDTVWSLFNYVSESKSFNSNTPKTEANSVTYNIKYRATNEYNASNEKDITITVKTNAFTMNASSGTFAATAESIATYSYAYGSTTLGSSTYAIYLTGNQNISLYKNGAIRTGYNHTGYNINGTTASFNSGASIRYSVSALSNVATALWSAKTSPATNGSCMVKFNNSLYNSNDSYYISQRTYDGNITVAFTNGTNTASSGFGIFSYANTACAGINTTYTDASSTWNGMYLQISSTKLYSLASANTYSNINVSDSNGVYTFDTYTTPSTASISGSEVFPYKFGYNVVLIDSTPSITANSVTLAWTGNGSGSSTLNITLSNSDIIDYYKSYRYNSNTFEFYPIEMGDGYTNINDTTISTTLEYTSEDISLKFLPTFESSYPGTIITISNDSIPKATADESNVYGTTGANTVTAKNDWTAAATDATTNAS